MIGPSVSAQRVARWYWLAGLAAAWLPLMQLQGQVIRGKVVEFRSDLPVQQAQITLLDAKKHELDVATQTDSLGEFVLRVPAPGRYIVRARRLGYDEFLSIPKDVKATDTVRVNLWPEANGQLLDSIVSLDSRSPTARGKSFAARQRAGRGQFLDRRKIQKEEYLDLEEALTLGMPGLEIRRREGQVIRMCFRSCCSFAIYRNGIPTSPTGWGARESVRQLEGALSIRGENLYGVELFSGRNEIPMEYRAGAGDFCGVLAVWTRTPD